MRTHTAVRFGGCFLDFCACWRARSCYCCWLAGERSGFGAMRAFGSPECRPGARCMRERREETRAVCVGGEHARCQTDGRARMAKALAMWIATHTIIAPDRARILDSSSQRMAGQPVSQLDYIEKVFRQHLLSWLSLADSLSIFRAIFERSAGLHGAFI